MNIVTALQNPEINKNIKEKTKYNIITNDIQYQEGIIELLEKNEEIDLIIISELLPGNMEFKELINKIKEINKNIEIIVILENKNNKLKEFLIQKNINSIFYNNQITIDELINIINEKEKTTNQLEINKEIKLLKEIILENNKNINKKTEKIKIINDLKNKIKKEINKVKEKLLKNNREKIREKNKTKIISIVGTPGVGKSIFISLFSKNIKNKKILIIDFDIYNKSIDLIFGYNMQKEKNIIKINNNIDLLSKVEMFFIENNYNNYIEKNKIKNILNKFSKKYDLIIIDNTSEYSCEYTKEILKNSDEIIFLTDANLIELNKTKKMLEKYINKWKIEKEKTNIVFNKINVNSINNKILKNLFSDFNILGKINFSDKYNLIINNNLKIVNKKINKEYLNIIKKLNLN